VKTVQFQDGKAVEVVKRFSCDELVELVTAFLEKDLDESTRSRFEEHLVGCEGCEHYLAQFRTTVDTLGTLRSENLPGDRDLSRATRDRLLTAFRDRRTA
jgi:anti-sigma factor RsiW